MANENLQQCKECVARCICRNTANPNGFSCRKFAKLVEEKFAPIDSDITVLKALGELCAHYDGWDNALALKRSILGALSSGKQQALCKIPKTCGD